MPKTRPPYSSEFRRQMVELVRAGRDPADLAREFEPSAQAIRNWVVQADRQEGRREVKPVADALGTPEREAWRARRHGPDYGAKCVSSGWSVTFSQNPRPGSPARPARCRPGLPVHEREPGRLPNRYHDARASNQGGATKLRLHLGSPELGVSKAGDYAWLHRPPSAHAVADAALLKQVRTVHASSRATHGAPRVHAELRAGGKRYGRKRIARLMRDAGLVGASRRRNSPITTRRDKEARAKRCFALGVPTLRSYLRQQASSTWPSSWTPGAAGSSVGQ